MSPVPLIQVLAEALRSGAAGSIVSVSPPLRKIWVRAGEILLVESEEVRDRYTQILGRHGALTKTEILLIEEEFSGPGISEEEAIRSSDMLPAGELPQYGQKVFEERLMGAFDISGPLWTFQHSEIPPGLPSYPMPIVLAIVRGIRERFPLERLKAEFPIATADRYTFHPEAPKQLGFKLSRVEETLARVLDGSTGWTHVLTATKLSPKDAHAALFAMAVLGVVSPLWNREKTSEVLPGALPPAAGRSSEMQQLAAQELPDVLQLSEESSPEEVDKAFADLVNRYDLGRAHQLPDADRAAALALLDRATDAYLVFSWKPARGRYLDAAPWDREGVAAGLSLDLAPEKSYLKAGIFLRAGNCLAAEAAMLPALHAAPLEARFHLRMGIAIYQRARARGGVNIPSGAARALEKAAALGPEESEPWLYLGHIAASAGDKARAVACYRRAVDLDAGSEEARLALKKAEAG